MSFVVAIDGPAGTGKGTISKIISEKCGLVNIDTGAMYRAVTVEMINKNIKLEDEEKINKMLENINIELKIENGEQRIILNDVDVTKRIREADVTKIVSFVSGIKQVRLKMADMQRKIGEKIDVVMEGRDIGTYVFPNADVKIYLDADVEERAKRRYIQNQEKGIEMPFKEILENIKIRDENDKNKEIGALKKAEDAVLIDTTNLTIEQVTQRVEKIIKARRNKNV